MSFTGVKCFSATKARDREALGEKVTEWLRDPAQRGVEVVGKEVRSSSDREFHCLSVTLFYRRAGEGTIRQWEAEAQANAKAWNRDIDARMYADGAESLKPRRTRTR